MKTHGLPLTATVHGSSSKSMKFSASQGTLRGSSIYLHNFPVALSRRWAERVARVTPENVCPKEVQTIGNNIIIKSDLEKKRGGILATQSFTSTRQILFFLIVDSWNRQLGPVKLLSIKCIRDTNSYGGPQIMRTRSDDSSLPARTRGCFWRESVQYWGSYNNSLNANMTKRILFFRLKQSVCVRLGGDARKTSALHQFRTYSTHNTCMVLSWSRATAERHLIVSKGVELSHAPSAVLRSFVTFWYPVQDQVQVRFQSPSFNFDFENTPLKKYPGDLFLSKYDRFFPNVLRWSQGQRPLTQPEPKLNHRFRFCLPRYHEA